MRDIKTIETDIKNVRARIASIETSYNPASNKAHIVERELDKLTNLLMDFMCEYHLVVEEYDTSEIDENIGTQYSMKEFRMLCGDNEIDDESGVAYYVNDKNQEVGIQVFPSWVLARQTRKEFNFVIWYTSDEISQLLDQYDVDDLYEDEEF